MGAENLNENTKDENVTKQDVEDALYPNDSTSDNAEVEPTQKEHSESEDPKKDEVAALSEGDKKEEGEQAKSTEEKEEEVDYKLELMKDSVLDTSQVEGVETWAKENKLSKEVAQAVLSKQEEVVSNYIESESKKWETQLDTWRNEVISDTVMGGENLKTTSEDARRVVERFGGEGLTEILKATGFGDHPEVVRFLSNIGKKMSEDSLILPTGEVVENKPIEDFFYGRTK